MAVAPAAFGQEPAAPVIDKPAAEKLFEEGRAELDAGRPDAACNKFEQSLKKDPRAVGTLLNLGLCNERQGKVASALALFIEAYDRANEAGQAEQRKAAEEHIATLRPQVPIVAISFSEQLAGQRLVVDDRVVASDATELPLDPGPHTIVLTAPGRLPYETTLAVKVATRVPLKLPALALPPHGASTKRVVAKVSLIGGGALLLGAGGLAIYARQHYHAQFDGNPPHCGIAPPIDGKEVCDAEGVTEVTRARRFATAATIVGGIGLAAVGAGVALWLTGPGETRIVPSAGASGGGVTLVGRF
jgi:tetratricopeptide (TPR) repeat protein